MKRLRALVVVVPLLIGSPGWAQTPFIPAKESDPGVTTHEITSGGITLGITDKGGGMINKFTLPGYGDIMDDVADRYGRGGQTAVRSLGHSHKYNPTQAGLTDEAGTQCNITATPGKLVVDKRPCCLWRADNQYDFVEWEDLCSDKYNDGGTSGHNSDVDGIDETNLVGKQATEITSEFDFYCEYEDYMGTDGVDIPCFRHYYEFEFARYPGHCLDQFGEGTSIWSPGQVVADISVNAPSGIHRGTDQDMNTLTHWTTLRTDNDLWAGDYRHVVLVSGDWHTEARTAKYQPNIHLEGAEVFPMLIISNSLDRDVGPAIGVFQPNSEIVAQQTVGGTYTDDRRKPGSAWLSDDPDRAGQNKFGFGGRTWGLLNRNRTPNNDPEMWRGEMYFLVGTPNEIYANALKINGYDVPPVISNLTPGNNASNTPLNTALVATFTEPVQAGSGSITLKKRSDDSTIETFDVTDSSAVRFEGTQLTLVPSTNLQLDTAYYVEIPESAVQDLSGTPYEGFSGNSHWSFSTIATNSIVLVNSASKVVLGPLGNSSTSFAFDASADMIIVAVSTERSGGNVAVRYDGHTLSNAVDAGTAGIWYLDLTETDYAGGSANLEIDFADVDVVNGVGVGVVSVSASGMGIELHTTETGTDSLVLSTTRNETFNVVSFNANSFGNPSVNAPLTKIYANGNIGSAQGAAGYQANVPAGDHTYAWTTGDKRAVVAAAFALRDQSFSGWLEQYDLGALTNLGGDPDGDGVPNGIEAWFGSHPGEFSSGLIALNVNGAQISFTHPQGDPPPTDLQLSYRWSTNLIDWYDCDGTDGPLGGGTVSVSSETAGGTATVTVTPSDELDCLFLRPLVQQN